MRDTPAIRDPDARAADNDADRAVVGGPILALDSGSPVVSVALGAAGEVWGTRSVAQASSSESLLALVDELLAERGLRPRDLAAVVGARGPGSFTGLRVGLATLLGLHQALAVPAAAIPTLELLAASVAHRAEGRIVAAVDALRGEWFVQTFGPGRPPSPSGAARCVAGGEMAELAPCRLVGFGVEALSGTGLEVTPATALAPAIVRLATRRSPAWRVADLLTPLYLRPPAATPPPRRRDAARTPRGSRGS